MGASEKTLRVTRLILAPPERVFAAWTDPEEVRQWWGPKGVSCRSAVIELRVGGSYEIENVLADGSILRIGGEFEVVEAPKKLVYTWSVNGATAAAELVTVFFENHPAGTEITIAHQKIPTDELRDSHEQGWSGCLAGLIKHLSNS